MFGNLRRPSIPEQLGEEFTPPAKPSRSCHDPSAVGINVKLYQSPTHPPSQSFPLAFQSSINVISSCTCLHYDYFSPPPPLPVPPSHCPPPCALAVLSFSSSFISVPSLGSSPQRACVNPSFCFHR